MKNYVIEKTFAAYGYPCVIAFLKMGHRCGYVAVPPEHPLYGKTGSDYTVMKCADHMDREMTGILPAMIQTLSDAEYFRIDTWFQVHGGITYADNGLGYLSPTDGIRWWFGFDCAHAGDSRDEEGIRKYFDAVQLTLLPYDDEGIVRDLDYVIGETVNLAKQLREYELEVHNNAKQETVCKRTHERARR